MKLFEIKTLRRAALWVIIGLLLVVALECVDHGHGATLTNAWWSGTSNNPTATLQFDSSWSVDIYCTGGSPSVYSSRSVTGSELILTTNGWSHSQAVWPVMPNGSYSFSFYPGGASTTFSVSNGLPGQIGSFRVPPVEEQTILQPGVMSLGLLLMTTSWRRRRPCRSSWAALLAACLCMLVAASSSGDASEIGEAIDNPCFVHEVWTNKSEIMNINNGARSNFIDAVTGAITNSVVEQFPFANTNGTTEANFSDLTNSLTTLVTSTNLLGIAELKLPTFEDVKSPTFTLWSINYSGVETDIELDLTEMATPVAVIRAVELAALGIGVWFACVRIVRGAFGGA